MAIVDREKSSVFAAHLLLWSLAVVAFNVLVAQLLFQKVPVAGLQSGAAIENIIVASFPVYFGTETGRLYSEVGDESIAAA